MTSRLKVIWPAALLIAVSLALLVYAFFIMKNGHPGGPPAGGAGERPMGRPPGEELFKLLGTIAIGLGAVSYSWFQLKRRMRASSALVRTLGKWVYRIHTFAGYAALLAVVVHGVYFVTEKWGSRDVMTGLAAFVMLLAVTVYGIWLGRSKGKLVRKTHFVMTNVWALALLLHASGQVIMVAGIMLFCWAVVWLMSRTLQPVDSKSQA